MSGKMALNYHEQALKNLLFFADCEEKDGLVVILDYAISRIF
jgi:hypothetical protein